MLIVGTLLLKPSSTDVTEVSPLNITWTITFQGLDFCRQLALRHHTKTGANKEWDNQL